jgi:hypothetical protein
MPGSPWAWAAHIHAPAKLTIRPRKVWQPVRLCERDAASIIQVFLTRKTGIVMDLGIAGKWALVGGASKGLGRGCAAALVREGVHVVIVARGAEALERTAAALRAHAGPAAQVLAVAADITTAEGRAAVFGVAGGPGYRLRHRRDQCRWPAAR